MLAPMVSGLKVCKEGLLQTAIPLYAFLNVIGSTFYELIV